MKALLVDDEQNCRENLKFLLEEYCDGISEIELASSVDEAVILFHSFKPKIIFLDIQMPGKNGFDLLKEIDTQNVAVVFSTAHDEFAIRAIKCSPLAYILKPIDIEELVEVVDRALANLKLQVSTEHSYNEAINSLTASLTNGNAPTRICLAHTSKLQMVELKDITYLKSDGDYSIFHLTDGKKITMSKTLKNYEFTLGHRFLRIHRSFLVNLDYIKEYNFDDGKVKLASGRLLDVSRRKSAAVVQRMKEQ